MSIFDDLYNEVEARLNAISPDGMGADQQIQQAPVLPAQEQSMGDYRQAETQQAPELPVDMQLPSTEYIPQQSPDYVAPQPAPQPEPANTGLGADQVLYQNTVLPNQPKPTLKEFVTQLRQQRQNPSFMHDLGQTISDHINGGVAGYNELQKQNTNLADMYVHNEDGSFATDENGNAILKPEYTQNDADFQTGMRQKALQTFNEETVKPTAMMLPMIPGMGAAGAIAAAPFIGEYLGNQAAEGYDKNGIAGAAWNTTFEPIYDFANDPNLGQKWQQHPFQTAAEGGMALAQGALPVLGARYGYKGVKKGTDKLKEVQDEFNRVLDDNPYEGMANTGLDALDQYDSPTRGFRPATKEELKQTLVEQLQALQQKKWDEQENVVNQQRYPEKEPQQALLNALEQIKGQKFDDAASQAYMDYLQKDAAEQNALQAQKNDIAGSVLMNPVDRLDVGADLPNKRPYNSAEGVVLGEQKEPSQLILPENKPTPPREEKPFSLPSAENLVDEIKKEMANQDLQSAVNANDYAKAEQIAQDMAAKGQETPLSQTVNARGNKVYQRANGNAGKLIVPEYRQPNRIGNIEERRQYITPKTTKEPEIVETNKVRNVNGEPFFRIDSELTAPEGFSWFCNQKSRFGDERKTVLLTTRLKDVASEIPVSSKRLKRLSKTQTKPQEIQQEIIKAVEEKLQEKTEVKDQPSQTNATMPEIDPYSLRDYVAAAKAESKLLELKQKGEYVSDQQAQKIYREAVKSVAKIKTFTNKDRINYLLGKYKNHELTREQLESALQPIKGKSSGYSAAQRKSILDNMLEGVRGPEEYIDVSPQREPFETSSPRLTVKNSPRVITGILNGLDIKSNKLKGTDGKLYSGFDPSFGRFDDVTVKQLVQPAIDYGRQLVSKGVQTAQEFARAMKEYLGDKWDTLKPHMQAIWEHINNERGAVRLGGEDGPNLRQSIEALYPKESMSRAALSGAMNRFGAISNGLKEAGSAVRNLFAPASADAYSKRGSQILRSSNGEYYDQRLKDENSLKQARDFFDTLPKADQVEISCHMQDPKYNFSGPAKEFVDAIRDSYGPVGKELVDRGFLDSSNEYYHAQLWENTPANKAKIDAWRGDTRRLGKGFLKEKEIPSYEVGIRLGLKPKYTNPVDVAFQRLGEERKFLTMQNFLEEISAEGMLSDTQHQGWTKVDSSLTSHWGGSWYVPESVGRLINNTMSIGIRDMKGAGPIYRAYMMIGNTINQFQLMGGFHAGFTSAETMQTRQALALKYGELATKAMTRGDYKTAGDMAVRVATNTANVLTAPVTSYRAGSKLLSMLGDESHANNPIVQLYKMGGGRVKLDTLLVTDFRRAFRIACKQGEYAKAVGNAPLAGVEKAMSYIIENLVPRQKLGAFTKMAEYELKRDPNLLQNRAKAQEVAGRLIDSVDNRLGQMNYDNLHWNNKVKDGMMGTFRAPGWMIGTIRELLGGVIDTAGVVKRAKAGDDLITHRMSYALALPMTTMMLNTIGQMLSTGTMPEGYKDNLLGFKNGLYDVHGVAQRSTFPTYMKDVYHWISSPAHTAVNKVHPLISALANLYNNKDYYGVQIHDKDDSYAKQAADVATYAAKQFLPFSISGGVKTREEGGSWAKTLLPQIGITRAPAAVNKSDAEKVIADIYEGRRKTGAMTQEEFEKIQLKRTLARGVADNGGATKELRDAVVAKKISPQEARNILATPKQSSIQHGINHLGIDDAMKVWEAADDTEKQQIRPIIYKKIAKSKTLTQEQKKAMVATIK